MTHKRSSSSNLRKLLYFLVFAIVLLSIAVIVLSVLLSKTKQTNNICLTQNCVKAANSILKNIDESVDPCENFFEFSCGNFLKTQRIQDDQTKISEFSMLRDTASFSIAELLSEPINSNDSTATSNAKKLFASCMDEETIELLGITKILKIFNEELGGWPILSGNDYQANYTLVEKQLLLKRIETSQWFELFVSINPKDPKHNILRIAQPSWFFNKEYIYNKHIMNAYAQLMSNTIKFLNPLSSNFTDEVKAILDLEIKFAMLQIDEDQKRNLTYKNLTIEELDELIPEFNWSDFIINGVFKNIENVTINKNETILVDDWDYLVNATKLFNEYQTHNPRDMDNLLMWIFTKEVISYLPKKFQEEKLKFDQLYHGAKNPPKRLLQCANLVNSKMENAVGRLYITKHFDKHSKAEAQNMVDSLLEEFKKILNETEWMDNESKLVALEKANYIDTKIGYSESLLNDTYLNKHYENVNFSSSEFLLNQINSIKFESILSLSSLRKDQDPKDWISGPAVVNAFYSPTSNQICFPAGILQPPFYDKSNPKYLNYGGIGTVIGHEITHGFDDMGRMYDKNGVYYSDQEGTGLWSNNTIRNYKNKVQCIIDQYGNYVVNQVNKTINGINTQGENIADNGGIKESFRAYKRWVAKNGVEKLLPGLEKYTPEQMFFINFGQLWCGKSRNESMLMTLLQDTHSPGEYRVIGSTSNFDEFAKAFQCKKGQYNNPEKKCSVW